MQTSCECSVVRTRSDSAPPSLAEARQWRAIRVLDGGISIIYYRALKMSGPQGGPDYEAKPASAYHPVTSDKDGWFTSYAMRTHTLFSSNNLFDDFFELKV